jgi:hypothetical protein
MRAGYALTEGSNCGASDLSALALVMVEERLWRAPSEEARRGENVEESTRT